MCSIKNDAAKKPVDNKNSRLSSPSFVGVDIDTGVNDPEYDTELNILIFSSSVNYSMEMFRII